VSRLALGALLLLLMAAAWGTPSVSRFQLANGLQVIVERVPNAPLTAVEVWVRAGVAQETAETSGVAHLLEHLPGRCSMWSCARAARFARSDSAKRIGWRRGGRAVGYNRPKVPSIG